jgi:nitrogenase subunit NifH
MRYLREKNEREEGQLRSLQNYLAEANQIREQFDANRIAKDQVKIMQELKMENVDLSCRVKNFEAKQKEVELISEHITKLRQDLLEAREAKGQAFKEGFE